MASTSEWRNTGPAFRFVRKYGGRRWFGWLGRRVIFPLERWLWTRRGASVVEKDFPELLLTTTGRHSGQRRSVPVLYLEHEGKLVVVASNWGRKNHPAWSDNLLAEPQAEVRLAGSGWPVRARLATAIEKQDLWPRLLALYPGWHAYRERSGRDFRIFVLEKLPA